MENIKVRKAKLADLPELLEFEQGVVAAERPFDKSYKDGKITYYDLERLISADDSELVVAEFEGRLVGSGYALIKEAKPHIKYRHFSYLGFMYVDSLYRGKGINQLIVNTLTEWSKSKGVYNMHLEVYDQNQAAIRAYEKAGFHRGLVEMRLELEK